MSKKNQNISHITYYPVCVRSQQRMPCQESPGQSLVAPLPHRPTTTSSNPLHSEETVGIRAVNELSRSFIMPKEGFLLCFSTCLSVLIDS